MQNQYQWKKVDELPVIEELPDPFIKPDGNRVCSIDEWEEQREYLKSMLEHYMYGPIPPNPGNVVGKVIESEIVHEGRAVHERLNIKCSPNYAISFDVHIIRPNRSGRFPVITWNCFKDMSPCPVEEEAVCERGYVIAMFEKEQLARDNRRDYGGPVHSAYPDYNWKAMAVWAWGHMRIIDYLESTDYADMDRIIATGHSRGGKAVLCAAIFDERISLAVPNGSGCGGAGCFRFLGGREGLSQDAGICESLGRITAGNPHWFADELSAFGMQGKPYSLMYENRLPFDLHIVKALIAPRLLLDTEGIGDEYANPYGTQVTWNAANEVYEFLNAHGKNAIHYREGGHDFNKVDWTVLLDFADDKLKGCPREYKYPVNNLPFPDAKLHYTWRRPDR